MSSITAIQSTSCSGSGQLQLIANISLMTINAGISRRLAHLPPCNRPGASFAEHMRLPFNPAFNTERFTLFPRVPQELKNMIWKSACSDPEIISVDIVRLIVGEKSLIKKVMVNGRLIKRHFCIKYFAMSSALDLKGESLTRHDGGKFWRDGVKFACVESHRIYLNVKPDQLRLFKSGRFGIIRFNAEYDTISLPRRTRFFLHQIGRRRRNYSPWFYGFENIQRIACTDEVNEDTAMEELAMDIGCDYATTINNTKKRLLESKNSEFMEDSGWQEEVDLEETKLMKELGLAKNALKKLASGTLLRSDVKIFFFPMTENNLLGQEDEATQDGSQSA